MTITVTINLTGQIDVHHHILVPASSGDVIARAMQPLFAALEVQVSQLSDAIAAASSSVDAAIARVQTDVSALKDQITALQAQVDAGTASPADMQALADLKAKVDAIDPSSPSVLPT